MFTLAIALACTADGVEDSGPTGSTEMSEPRHPEAAYTAEEAASALREAVRFGIPLPPPTVATWRELMAHGDDECPGGQWDHGALEVFPPDGCTAASGYWYQGVGSAQANWMDEDRDGNLDLYRQEMKTDGAMMDAEGNKFYFGGAILLELSGTPEAGGTYEAEILGTYGYPLAESLWMQAGASTGSYLSGEIAADGSFTLLGNGGFTVGEQSVGMEDFTMNVGCPGLPGGTLGVRDEAGYWYDLTYDETTCDSCGEVVFDNTQSLGRACAEVTPAFESSFDEVIALMGEQQAPP